MSTWSSNYTITTLSKSLSQYTSPEFEQPVLQAPYWFGVHSSNPANLRPRCQAYVVSDGNNLAGSLPCKTYVPPGKTIDPLFVSSGEVMYAPTIAVGAAGCDFTYCHDGGWVQGKVGNYALWFRRTPAVFTHMTTPSATDIEFNNSDDFTVACWVSSSDTSTGEKGLVRKSTSAPVGGPPWMSTTGWSIWTRDGYIGATIEDSGGWNPIWSPSVVMDGDWHHIVLRRNGTTGTGSLWIDGVQGDDLTGSQADLGQEMEIAGDVPPYHWYDGLIDEVGIWNTELDSGAISDLYNSGAGVRSDTVSSSNLVLYYDFEMGGGPLSGNFLSPPEWYPPGWPDDWDTSKLIYDVALNHTGTIQSNVGIDQPDFGNWTAGKVGKYSLQFIGYSDRTRRVVVADASPIQFGDTDDFTVACWALQMNNHDGYGNGICGLVSKKTVSGSYYPGWAMGQWQHCPYWGCSAEDNYFYCTIQNSSSVGGGARIFSDAAYSPGNPVVEGGTGWHHLVLRRIGASSHNAGDGLATLWVDGIIQADTTNQTLDDSSQDMVLGRLYDNSDVYATMGKIDEVGLWNVALDTGSILNLYSGSLCNAVSSSNLVAYYDMECNGPGSDILKDLSGNDLSGTLTNMLTGTCVPD